MNVPFLIAKRYFISKKKRNIINIISIISMVGVAVGTAALIIVLSVFNGLEDLIRSIYGSFDPDLKITSIEGKGFELNEDLITRIRKTPGVLLVTEVIEDNALLRYEDRQMVIKMKGVSPNFFAQNKIDSAVIEGNYQLQRGGNNYALIGRGVQYQLSIRATNAIVPMFLLYPKAKASLSLDPENTFREKPIMVGGVFVIERQYDDNYIFVPLDFARDLLAYGNKRTSLEVRVESKRELKTVEKRLEEVLGPKFEIKNSDEQHLSLLRAVKVEKMFVFITFAFILLIASLNIFFSLSMLVIDKKKDIAILASIGASPQVIRNIFLAEGAIVAFVGAFIGLALGLLVCWIQETFGLISMNMATALVEAYPVKMKLQDFLLTGLAIFIITLLVSIRPARAAAATEVRDNI
ncbi:ABC transporter permease [Adhaeribacter radiodurans]|uniref:ABC transporter permease n=1 Tax=Adhaeribacter radiodurans TaxID=2745197 RepID=A0A7L7LF00_9BACT|nr:ABC transporter permease [Adhaeribacter radiodurans]QMU30959.1 ABC transporter permease [Adhaeribacter radiodurans]